MNIMNHLTKKHMKSNKKRSIMTVLGVIISVAMITAVSSASTSFLNYLQKIEMSHYGNWHVKYMKIEKGKTDVLENDANTKNVFYMNTLGYGKIVDEELKNPSKPFLYIEKYTKETMQEMNLKLVNGRFPENENEIIIPNSLTRKENKDFMIGDEITLDIGDRYVGEYDGETILNQSMGLNPADQKEEFYVKENRTYKIVGIIERAAFENYNAPGYTCFTYMNMDQLSDSDQVNAYVFEKKVSKKIYRASLALANKLSIDSSQVDTNDDLLSYYGVGSYQGFNRMIEALTIILIVIIMLGSISLIYNSFAISITERSKQFGMLSSVGATKKQKRNAVFYEGMIIGAIAIPIGIGAGILGMGVTFRIVEPMLRYSVGLEIPLRLYVNVNAIVIAVLFSIATILISAYIPARRAAKISALDAIRQTTDIKLSKKSVKTNGLVRKIFGIEGDLALKNLKRNRRSFRALVFSLFISLVLFISVSSYVYYVKDAFKLTIFDFNYDISLSFQNDFKSDHLLNEIREIEGITDGTLITKYTTNIKIQNEFLKQHMLEEYKKVKMDLFQSWGWSKEEAEKNLFNEEEGFCVNFNVLDDRTYEQYLKKIGDRKEGKLVDGIPAILLNHQRGRSGYNMMESDLLDVKKNDIIPLEDPVNTGNLKICLIAVTDQLPMGMEYAPIQGNVNLIVSKEVMDEIIQIQPDVTEYCKVVYMFSADQPQGIDDQIESAIHGATDQSYFLYNRYNEQKRNEQMMLVMSIFAYGFIVLISLICIANLCNTIATSCTLRRREFAMLKSVGMTPKSFHKMVRMESLFYGIKALLYGIPTSLLVTYLIYKSVHQNYFTAFTFPWLSYGIGIVSVFLVVGIAMSYSTAKIKNESIINGLKSEIE